MMGLSVYHPVIFTYIAKYQVYCVSFIQFSLYYITILSHIYVSASFVNNILITHTFVKEGTDFYLNSIGVNFYFAALMYPYYNLGMLVHRQA